MKKGSPLQMRRRVLVAGVLIIAVGVGLIANLARLQMVQGEELQQKAVNQQMRDTAVNAERGTIYDTNMEVMAQSATVWNVYISPADIKGTAEVKEKKRRTIANGLAEILGVDADTIYEKTLKDKSYQVYLKKKVENDIREQVLAFEKENSSVAAVIGLEEDTKRYYPNGDLAATVLGFTGTDGQGLAGVEAYYDSELTGIPGRVLTIKNAIGTEMDFEYEQRVDAKDGNSLVLSIDRVIQGYLEKNLDRALEDYQAKRAVGIVMNVNTFEVLGMATRNAFDPNNPFVIADKKTAEAIAQLPEDKRAAAISAAQNLQWRNTAISDPYEPGSVFKAITACAALDEGVVKLNSTFKCPGYYVVGGWSYGCNNHAVHGTLNVIGALENSCNISFIQIGQKLGAAAFCQYYRAFGLSERTGIDLPGEMNTIAGVHYHAEKNMGVSELASSSFGQSQKMTPMQMATAMAAVVNGGYLGVPHIVRQIIDENGNIVSTKDAGTRRQVVSEHTSEQVALALEQVVVNGGGKNAAVEGYRVGGKTGTAEKLDGDRTARAISFCGFAPVNDPEIVCIVMVDEPQAGSYGSTLAAPLFKSIMEDVLPYLGVEKTGETEGESKSVSVPKVLGSSVKEATEVLKKSGLTVTVLGEGETVLSQFPNPQTLLREDGVVVLFTSEESREILADVPDFTKKTLREANQAAANAGINIRISGSATSAGAIVAKQSIAYGSKVTPGTIITLDFIVERIE